MEKPKTVERTENQARLADQTILAEFLVSQYYPYLYRLAVSILYDLNEADDAVQEAILRAMSHWQQSPTGAEQRGWLTVLTINHCRDRLRRRKTRHTLVSVLQVLHLMKSNVISLEDMVVTNQQNSALWKSVQELDEKHRLPVILRFIHGMSAAEISKSLGISEGTVYSRLHYAIRKLRDRLGPTFEEGGLK